MNVMVLASQAVVVVVQPEGELRNNAEEAAQGGSQIGSAVADFFSTWASSEYGWVLGAIVLYLIARFFFRLVRG